MSIALTVFIEALVVITVLLGSAGAAMLIERRRKRSGADLRSMQKWHEAAEANRRSSRSTYR